MGMPVSEAPQPRYLVTPAVGATPTQSVSIDGGASAGSRHLLGAADAAAEMVKLAFLAADNVREVRLSPIVGQGAHGFSIRAVVGQPDGDAAVALNTGYPDVVERDDGVHIYSSDAITTVHVIAVPVPGATPASVVGKIVAEGVSYA